MNRTKTVLIASALLLSGCQKAAERHDFVSPFRAPSATEAFDLQSKCVALGQRVLDGNVIGPALTQEQVSHYNATDNRCYVRLNVHTADLTTPKENYISDEILYDGQTGEMLATRSFKGGQRSANVFDDNLRKMLKDPIVPSADDVGDLMDKFTGTDRHS